MQTEKIKQSIIANELILPGEHVGVAVSGGADSVFLLHALVQLKDEIKFELSALHLEHGIRGRASRRDMAFVQRLCKGLGVPLTVEQADAVAYARKNGFSLEQAARELRYAFFERCAEAKELDKIALAHHLDDQAETILLNLTRGCGMQGLLGMQAFRAPLYIRPMLEMTKAEILTELKRAKIAFRSDRTNRDTDYARNRIRHRVLPELVKINAQAGQNMLRTAGFLSDEDDYIRQAADQAVDACVTQKNGEVRLALDGWEQVHPAVRRRVVRQILSTFFSLTDVEFIHIESIIGISLSQNGKKTKAPGGVTAARAYGYLVFFKDAKPDGSPVAVETGRDMAFDFSGYRFNLLWLKKAEYTAGAECLDAEKLSASAFRNPLPDDDIQPLGMTGKKRLSDYLSDRKVPLHLRAGLPVLAHENTVLMVTGVGISETVKVTEETQHICRIEFKKL